MHSFKHSYHYEINKKYLRISFYLLYNTISWSIPLKTFSVKIWRRRKVQIHGPYSTKLNRPCFFIYFWSGWVFPEPSNNSKAALLGTKGKEADGAQRWVTESVESRWVRIPSVRRPPKGLCWVVCRPIAEQVSIQEMPFQVCSSGIL